MKKKIVIILSLCMIFSLVSCKDNKGNENELEIKEAESIEVPEFKIKVCGIKVTNEDLKDLTLYEIKTNTVNSSGTEKSYVYVGYKFSDILSTLKIEGEMGSATVTCTDGFEYTYEGDIKEEGVLLGITKDGEFFKDGPWFSPCVSNTTGDYAQDLKKIEIAGIDSSKDDNNKNSEESEDIAFPQDPVVEDKTDKIKFADYSFKINGNEVTNKDLDGLKIFRITVTVKNSKEVVSQSKYSGYVLKDVLEKLGLSGSKVKAIAMDGYESEIDLEDIDSELTLIAIEKDKEVGENGTIWIAPCTKNKSASYIKEVVEITVE